MLPTYLTVFSEWSNKNTCKFASLKQKKFFQYKLSEAIKAHPTQQIFFDNLHMPSSCGNKTEKVVTFYLDNKNIKDNTNYICVQINGYSMDVLVGQSVIL